jgi:hypothetical protein
MVFQRITKQLKCPVCKSESSFRVKRAGLSVKMVCGLLNVRPHWCPECDTFYLGPRRSKDLRMEHSYRSAGNLGKGGTQPQPGNLPH